jgi:hypothetical protein
MIKWEYVEMAMPYLKLLFLHLFPGTEKIHNGAQSRQESQGQESNLEPSEYNAQVLTTQPGNLIMEAVWWW